MFGTSLPITEIIGDLQSALATPRNVVLQAPPGAGKTTIVPLALLNEPWLETGRTILMLEPRRLAARAAAARMAELLHEPVGQTVGYRIRQETRVSRGTRIEVVTEGILTRMLLDDPELPSVGLVIFDEFHERSLHADTGMALALLSQQLLREELRILVMSATLDGAAVGHLLGAAPVVTSVGRSHSVETRYLPRRAGLSTEGACAAAAARAIRDDEGDVLVFLPGAGEIRRTHQLLQNQSLGSEVDIAPLHGTMAFDAQQFALRLSVPGRRKIVLATSIAETSLTIEGVRVVIDPGLSRRPRFSPRTGMTTLETVRVSRSSADQRRGRAGRLAPGVCYRLWAEQEDSHLLPHTPPEISDADLAPLALTLAEAGVSDPNELAWLDPPPAAAYAGARTLLGDLEAFDSAGALTPHGRQMAALPVHPRLAHMLLQAPALGLADTASIMAALLTERDVLSVMGAPGAAGSLDPDLRLRVDLLQSHGSRSAPRTATAPLNLPASISVHRDALTRVRAEAGRLRSIISRVANRVGTLPPTPLIHPEGLLLALAYPDRIGQARPGSRGRYLLRSGRGAMMDPSHALAGEPYIVAAELDGRRPESKIFLAAPIDRAELEHHLAAQIIEDRVIEWSDEDDRVTARRRTRLGAIVLAEAPLANPDRVEVARALLGEIARRGLVWPPSSARIRQRLAFLHESEPERWATMIEPMGLEQLEAWLLPHLLGMSRPSELDRIDLGELLLAKLTWDERQQLDRLAPTHIVVPSGSRLPVDYSDPKAPFLAVRIQELFGLADTPRIGPHTVPLTLQLLSPAHRPVQVTCDLGGFWRASYFDVRKQLRGRYPKHPWPDDPMSEPATKRTKRRP